MSKVSLKGQAVPLLFLLLLLAAAVVSTVTHERLKRQRRTFSIEQFERLMHRIDVAIGSISDTMVEEGMVADFEEILEGIRRVMRARAGDGRRRACASVREAPDGASPSRPKDGRSLPVVELQFILMKHNQRQRDRMRRIARELGVDRFIEKTVGINPVDPNFQSLADDLLPDDLSGSRYERRPDGEIALKGRPPLHCEWLNSTMLVLSNGDVVPCCYDVFSRHIMGNVFREPLKAIWRGEKMNAFRRCLARNRDAIPICAGCPEGRTELLRTEPVEPAEGQAG